MNSTDPPSSIVVNVAPEPDNYLVEVRDRRTTRHRVAVRPSYLEELGVADFPATRVLHEAFVFLLQREPNTEILPSFDLHDIARYFPEFPDEIGRRLRAMAS